jgi:glycosyltransferase involved in cell wall biosynthesis
MPDKFVLDIYGPIIDKNYWKKCADKIKNTESISYKGAIPPWDVSTVLKNYHFFVLPTEGENFGHAIFDALASGIPVIISKCSPWVSLDNAGAGFYLHELNFDSLINQAYSLTTNQYHQYRQNSLIYANRYISSRNYFSEYAFLLTR